MSKEKIGFIGLGTMGFAICYGLHKKGFSLVLPTYRREIDQNGSFIPLAPDAETKTALYDEMLANGCEGAENSAELFEKSDYIMISMPTSKQVEMNVLGADGILENAKSGAVVIDLTSADASSTRKLSEMLAEKGIELLDAPVSGGQAGAINQTLSVMIGGKKEVYEKSRHILETIGVPEKVIYVGPSGAGDTIKSVNNFLSCACLLATTEGVMVAAKAGIDPKTAIQVIASSGGASHAATYKYPELVFTGQGMNMPVDLMWKDIGLYVAAAGEAKVPSFIGNTVNQLFGLPSVEGNGGADFVEVVKMYEDWCGCNVIGIDKEETNKQ